MYEFGFRSSVHRALNSTENVAFGVFCFPEVHSYGREVLHDVDNEDNATVLEAEQSIFWTVHKWFMETCFFVDNV